MKNLLEMIRHHYYAMKTFQIPFLDKNEKFMGELAHLFLHNMYPYLTQNMDINFSASSSENTGSGVKIVFTSEVGYMLEMIHSLAHYIDNPHKKNMLRMMKNATKTLLDRSNEIKSVSKFDLFN